MTNSRLVNEALKQKLMNMKALDASTQLLEENIAPSRQDYKSSIKSKFNLLGEGPIPVAGDSAKMTHQDFVITPNEQKSQVERIKLAHRFLTKAQQYEFKNEEELGRFMAKDKSYQQLVGKSHNMVPKLLFDAYRRAHKNYLNPKHDQQKQERVDAQEIASKVLTIMKENKKEPKSENKKEQKLINFLKKHEGREFKDINQFISAMRNLPNLRADILFNTWKQQHQEFKNVQREQVQDSEVYSNVVSEQAAAMGGPSSSRVGPNDQYDDAAAGINSDGVNITLSSGSGKKSKQATLGKGETGAAAGRSAPTPAPAKPAANAAAPITRSSLLNASLRSSAKHNPSEIKEAEKKAEDSNDNKLTPFGMTPTLKPKGPG